MGTFAKGDVILFPFPYTGLGNRKLRPCLVISDIKDEQYKEVVKIINGIIKK